VNPLALLLLGQQVTLLSVRPDSRMTCPTPAQVNLALAARVPGMLVRPDQASAVGALTLELGRSEDGIPSMRLVAADGGERLRRELVTRDGSNDCTALAETVALIVERFLVDLDDRVARAATAARAAATPRRWDVSLAAGWRSGGDADGGLQAMARVDRLFGRRFQLSLAAGVGSSADAVPRGSTYTGQATIRRIPVELGLWWLRPFSDGELELGLAGGFEITRVSAHWDVARRDDVFPGPIALVAAGLRLPVGDYAFFRVTSSVGVALVRYDFYYSEEPDSPRQSVFTAPTRRFYAKIAGELGVAFPLTKKPSSGP